MLEEAVVAKIRDLLATSKLSQRAIAIKLGVNRQTVNWIANDKRATGHEKAKRREVVRELSLPIRCAACGHRIALIPCQSCRAQRALKRRASRLFQRPSRATSLTVIGLGLQEPELSRFLAIRRLKIERGEKPVSNRCLFEDVLGIGGAAMPVIQNIKYIRWFLSHIDELAPLLEVPRALREATQLVDKWAIIKQAGDIIASVLQTFPVVSEFRGASEYTLKADVEAAGIPWDRLIDLLPLLVRLITLLEQGETT